MYLLNIQFNVTVLHDVVQRFVSDDYCNENDQHHDERHDGRFGQSRDVPQHAQRGRDENRGHRYDEVPLGEHGVVGQREQPDYHLRRRVADYYVVAYHRCKKKKKTFVDNIKKKNSPLPL